MGNDAGLFEMAGWNGLFSIFVTLGCVFVSWIVLQEINFDKIARQPRGPRVRVLQLLLAIALGRMVAGFILDYWNWVGTLKWLFGSG
ncbi:DUF1146 domain-containing protein [Cohnella endophytica]|uniref:DUF1146 domain-containing protein n=1 Tax=Cohnella endophytica TaxID=2419778 RepID=A0A494XGL0_9BACL|nr:DUF1146 domain-containing protein [Cohnella endophytica]RKP47289.1 DUF1146 domain-containing protein [Cohnella endophytica]